FIQSAPKLMLANRIYPDVQRPVATIGFFIHDLTGGYQFTVLSGIADLAREQGVNLICFAGGELASIHDYYINRNALYDLANINIVDGLIITAGTIGNFIGSESLKKFFSSYHPL